MKNEGNAERIEKAKKENEERKNENQKPNKLP